GRECHETNRPLTLPPFRTVKISPIDASVDQNRMIADILDAYREDLSRPHPVEHCHAENQPFPKVEGFERENNVLRAHYPLLGCRYARGRIETSRRIQANRTITESHFENSTQVPPQMAD